MTFNYNMKNGKNIFVFKIYIDKFEKYFILYLKDINTLACQYDTDTSEARVFLIGGLNDKRCTF